MKIQQVQQCNPNFEIRIKPTKTSYYYPNCYIQNEVGLFKGREIIISKNFIDDKISSRLIYIKDKTGKWLKSKLKYFEDGKWKILKGEKNGL